MFLFKFIWKLIKFGVACIVILIIVGLGVMFFTDGKNIDAEKIIKDTQPLVEEALKNLTKGEANALSAAKNYLELSGFSYKGLMNQLEQGDGFTHAEAEYAVKNCGADWNEQAAKSAKQYLELSSFSRKGLIEQLVDGDGFTKKQAEYGVKQVGY
ncbi:MAG: Ltp family lipoprotein [Synergistaceae bacterium]|nr:Ltp family lipoprotein [Synergistaceae bacterium]